MFVLHKSTTNFTVQLVYRAQHPSIAQIAVSLHTVFIILLLLLERTARVFNVPRSVFYKLNTEMHKKGVVTRHTLPSDLAQQN